MAKIIVLDNLSQDGLDLLESTANIEYEVRTGLKGEELRESLMEFDGAICRSGVKITPESLEGNTRLKAIARAGVGTDNIDKPAATRQGIVVMNTPSGNTISTAEQSFALMMALSRNIAPAYQSLCEGRWDRKLYMGNQLAGKTLGVIGLGRIGQAVAARAQAFEMKVIGFDPFLTDAQANKLGIETVATPQDMFGKIDYLTVHTPLTDETRNLIDADAVAKMKPGVRLINCARGGIYNEAAMVEGLKSGQIGGVALDVYESEPCTDSPLFGMPNVVCTPHLGASTEEAQTNVAVEAVELLINFFTTGEIRQSVNMSPLDAATLEDMRSYLNLSYRLGLLLSQVDHQSPKKCRLIFKGEVAEKDTRLLCNAFAAGLVENAMESEVNIVNAEMLLKSRGIELIEERSTDISSFSSMITAEVTSSDRTAQASGALFGNDMPRLVQKSGCDLESYLDGVLMIFTHQDKPGVIGKVGSVFGNYDVNIAQMSVGRSCQKPGGEAIGIMSLDNKPPAEAVADVIAIEGVQKAWIVNLPEQGELPAWLGK
jgi:D-3-phosphoglycerate dehydrogenase / 2-oxoglutarate reductase